MGTAAAGSPSSPSAIARPATPPRCRRCRRAPSSTGAAEPCVLVPGPDGHRRLSRIEQAMLGWEAAMGPVVPLARASVSLRWARAALGLAPEASSTATASGAVPRHLSTLLIFSTRSWPVPCAPPSSRRWSGSARPSRTGWPRRCSPGCSTAVTLTRWRCACTFTRRPSGTGSARWMTCSVTSSATRPPVRAGNRPPGPADAPARPAAALTGINAGRPAVAPTETTKSPIVQRRGPLNPLLEPPMLIVSRLSLRTTDA